MKIKKTDAFLLVTYMLDSGDITKANEIMRIIQREMKKEKKNNTFFPYIEITNKKEIIFFENLFSKISDEEEKKEMLGGI